MPTKPTKKPKPDPVRPGDDVIAREEIEAYYRSHVEEAAAELAKAQAEFDRVSAESERKLEAFRLGGKLDAQDVPWIEMNAGGRVAASDSILAEVVDPKTTPERKRELAAVHEAAEARHAATTRWLRDQGYEVFADRDPLR